jgi:hypothetical protein
VRKEASIWSTFENNLIHVTELNPFSIIAMHGMSGNLEDSFVSKKTGYSWLRDALPQINPKARVLGYNYRGTPENIANSLLQDLIDDRGSQVRPHATLSSKGDTKTLPFREPRYPSSSLDIALVVH